MSEKVTPERVAMLAAAARVPLRSDAATRIANAVTPAVARFGEEKIALKLEIEPATYVVIARGGAKP
jgi:hypothetical protein